MLRSEVNLLWKWVVKYSKLILNDCQIKIWFANERSVLSRFINRKYMHTDTHDTSKKIFIFIENDIKNSITIQTSQTKTKMNHSNNNNGAYFLHIFGLFFSALTFFLRLLSLLLLLLLYVDYCMDRESSSACYTLSLILCMRVCVYVYVSLLLLIFRMGYFRMVHAL